jgi:hypothetical protein
MGPGGHQEVDESVLETCEWVDVDSVTSLDKLYPDLKVNLPEALKDSPEVVYTHLVFNENSEIVSA